MGECSCGHWYEAGKCPAYMDIYEKAILEFNKQNKFISSSDHFSGSCMVLFKGDYAKCMKVVDYIESLKD